MKFTPLLVLLLPLATLAQKLPTIEEKTKDMKKYEGFFNYYWDDATGKIWLDINKLDSEFLYLTTLPAGLGSNDIGLDKGLLTTNRVVKFNRVGRKILMVQPNYSFRANSPMLMNAVPWSNPLPPLLFGDSRLKQKATGMRS